MIARVRQTEMFVGREGIGHAHGEEHLKERVRDVVGVQPLWCVWSAVVALRHFRGSP